MLIEDVLNFCNKEYSKKYGHCSDCSHPNVCPGNCEACLIQIHLFPLSTASVF